uniref:Uncharacterized protein n=1 Tax=Anguilla anguilla TaxID=7936 RepID=A0A0E9VSR4_ANGAN
MGNLTTMVLLNFLKILILEQLQCFMLSRPQTKDLVVKTVPHHSCPHPLLRTET